MPAGRPMHHLWAAFAQLLHTQNQQLEDSVLTGNMSVEHVSPVYEGAASVMGMQHVHQPVPLLLMLADGPVGRALGNLELDQVQSSSGIHH